MKITKKRVLALALCLTLIVSCVGLVHADNSGKKSTDAAEATAETTVETTAETALPSERRSDGETVYVLTDAAGSVEKIIVSGQSREADGEAQAAQTQEQKELPVDVRISYRLNGRKIAPEELAGKSGRVEIRIDYTNNARAVKEIGGKEERFPCPS